MIEGWDFNGFCENSDANQRCSACLSRFHICFQCAALPQFPQLPREVSCKQCVGFGRKAHRAQRECTEVKRREDSAKPNPKGAQASARSLFEAIGVLTSGTGCVPQKSIKKAAGDAAAKDAAKAAKKRAEQIRRSKYALGKNPENLTDRQRERLSVIQAEDGPVNREHALKQQLRLILHMDDAETAAACLDRWTSHAQRCRIPSFVDLQRKIRRHREHILHAIHHGVSNARIEVLNNKIKLLIRIACGFRNVDTMISLVMLFCSNIRIPWPSCCAPMTINKG